MNSINVPVSHSQSVSFFHSGTVYTDTERVLGSCARCICPFSVKRLASTKNNHRTNHIEKSRTEKGNGEPSMCYSSWIPQSRFWFVQCLLFFSSLLSFYSFIHHRRSTDRCAHFRACSNMCACLSADPMSLSPLTSHAIVDIFKRCTQRVIRYEFSNEFLFYLFVFFFVQQLAKFYFPSVIETCCPTVVVAQITYDFPLAINLLKEKEENESIPSAVDSCGSEILFLCKAVWREWLETE